MSLLVKRETEFLAALRDYSPLSKPLFMFGKHGHTAGCFQNAKGVAMGEDYIYVTEETMNAVNIFTLDGKHFKTICSQLTTPSNGTYKSKSCLSSPFDVSIYHPFHQVLVTNKATGRVLFFSKSGQYLREFLCCHRNGKPFSCLSGIAVHTNGTIVCVDMETCQVTLFDYDGNFMNEFGEDGDENGQFGMPEYVAVDSRNNSIIVSDTINCRIQVFAMDGSYLFKQGESGVGWGCFEFPSGVAVDSYGNIFVSDQGLHRIQVFDRHGKFVHTFGYLGSSPGTFDSPRGIDVATGKRETIVIVDNENNRVQIF